MHRSLEAGSCFIWCWSWLFFTETLCPRWSAIVAFALNTMVAWSLLHFHLQLTSSGTSIPDERSVGGNNWRICTTSNVPITPRQSEKQFSSQARWYLSCWWENPLTTTLCKWDFCDFLDHRVGPSWTHSCFIVARIRAQRPFLDGSTHFYKTDCPLVRRSISRCVAFPGCHSLKNKDCPCFWRKRDEPTDQGTEGPTGGLTDGPRDPVIEIRGRIHKPGMINVHQ